MCFCIGQQLVCKTLTRPHRASFIAAQALLVNMLTTIERRSIFLFKFSYFMYFNSVQPLVFTIMTRLDSLAGRDLLVKMRITLETPVIFGSNLENIFVLTLSIHWYAKL